MVSDNVKNCTIFNEFDYNEKHHYFDFKDKNVLHHIDTFYYSVFLNEPDDVVKLEEDGLMPENFKSFIEKLRELKSYARKSTKEVLAQICGYEVSTKVFSAYEFCITANECYDIFIASHLPNSMTPRVLIQLRSRYIVLEGIYEAINKSYAALCEILNSFGLFPVKTRINRIDYAFHTNMIDNPTKYFSDFKLEKHLQTKLRTYQKIGKIRYKKLTIETFNLGSRKSNNVFFRAYNKGLEVIEMNYKAFFIDRWLENEMISNFDAYVYKIAYSMNSYRTGVLYGRLKWYIEHGKNQDLIDECKQLIKSCYIKSDNNTHIEEKIKGVIPEPTTIVNIEYQTKREFYNTCTSWMASFPEDIVIYDSVKLKGDENYKPPLDVNIFSEILFFLNNARNVIDYLTSYGNVVSFVNDNNLSLNDFYDSDKLDYCQWWQFLRAASIDYSIDIKTKDLKRKYENNASLYRTKRKLMRDIARTSILKNLSLESQPFVVDMTDALSTINDNDVPPVQIIPDENGEIFEPEDYQEIRARACRQSKGIVDKKFL